MKIEVWQDINCHFSYVAKQHFEEALDELNLEDLTVEYKSYLLDPDLQAHLYRSEREYLNKVFEMTPFRIDNFRGQLQEMAWEAGVNFDFENIKVANAQNAHRLTHFAKKEGKQAAVIESLFQAHFELGQDIDNANVLFEIAKENKLPLENAKRVIEDESLYAPEVQNDRRKAKLLKIESTPYYVINEKYSIATVQDKEGFKNALMGVRSL